MIHVMKWIQATGFQSGSPIVKALEEIEEGRQAVIEARPLRKCAAQGVRGYHRAADEACFL